MPQTTDEIRKKFMIDHGDYIDDGISTAESIIIAAGGSIKYGRITIPDWDLNNDDFWDAVQYLIEEWDYEAVQ